MHTYMMAEIHGVVHTNTHIHDGSNSWLSTH
jgi:hypothetical protein